MGLAVNGMAPPVVTWESLSAWCGLRKMSIDPWEALALVRLGQARASILSEKAEAANKSNAGKNKN